MTDIRPAEHFDVLVVGAGHAGIEAASTALDPAQLLFVPLRLRSPAGELSFVSTLATFGTALDVTLAELAIESFFPADAATAAYLRRQADAGEGTS